MVEAHSGGRRRGTPQLRSALPALLSEQAASPAPSELATPVESSCTPQQFPLPHPLTPSWGRRGKPRPDASQRRCSEGRSGISHAVCELQTPSWRPRNQGFAETGGWAGRGCSGVGFQEPLA